MLLRSLMIGALGLAWVAAAEAGETFDAAGKGMATDKSVVYRIGENHILIDNNNVYSTFEAADPNNPMNGMSGTCFGSTEVKAGVVTSNGICDWTDTGGDKAVIRWFGSHVDAKGTVYGTWLLHGGTGKWVGAAGGGTYAVSPASPDSKERVNMVEGAITLR